MSFSPSLSLVRLQELKLWQGNYENLLQKTRLNSQQSEDEHFEGVSPLDTSNEEKKLPEETKRNSGDWDKKTIMPSKPFEQLLEEKLAEDTPMGQQVKLKRPFLRKGQGLARFRMGGTPVSNKNKVSAPKKPSGSQKNTPIAQPIIQPTPVRKGILKKSNPLYHREIDLTPLVLPDFVKPRGTWRSVFENPEPKIEKEFSKEHPENNDEDEEEVENYEEFRKSLSPGGNVAKSVKETKMDEIDKEDHVEVEGPSRKSSVEVQQQSLPRPNFENFNKEILEKISEYAQKYFHPTRAFLSNGIPENISETSTPKLKHGSGDLTLYEQKMERELRIFEALEKKAENSSFCSTNTSVANLLASTPQKVGNINKKNEISKKKDHCPRLEISGEIEFTNDRHENIQLKLHEVNQKSDVLQHFLMNLKNIEGKGTYQENSTLNSDFTKRSEATTSTNTSFSDENTRWSTRSPSPTDNYTEFDTTCQSDSWKKIDAGVNTSFDKSGLDETVKKWEPCKDCEELRSKISDIKIKLNEFQSENSNLKTELREMEKKHDQLKKDMKKEKEKHQETIENLQEELDYAHKKLVKEKTYFETYVKESQNKPSKKEREELRQLKQELADAKELLKLKDTKNGATQARLRTQIKQQEKDISELKITVEKLQRDNAKLSASQKFMRRPQEVKMLHEINRNLSKLTEETFKKLVEKSGNGDAGENSEKQPEKERKKPDNFSDENGNKENDKSGKNVSAKDPQNATLKRNDSPLDLTNSEALSIEKQYENVFGNFASPRNNSSCGANLDKNEKTLPDGSIEITYSNGNFKSISSDGQVIVMKYFNGDTKETNLKEKIIRYHYAATDSWHIQYPDGTEVIEYKDGQKCKKCTDGKTEVIYPDGSTRIINTDGTEEHHFPDGRKTIKNLLGEQIILLPNGQREIHTKEYKRREYPDGTVRTLHKDGSVETVYANGRVRLKDASGKLIMDTHQS